MFSAGSCLTAAPSSVAVSSPKSVVCRAYFGQAENVAPRCNAPWVSAVIEASGDVRPCFFHPALGNIHRTGVHRNINGPEALRFRSGLDVASNPIRPKMCLFTVSGAIRRSLETMSPTGKALSMIRCSLLECEVQSLALTR
jgi:Iron-sulfur cluster-binding domain